MDQWLWRDAVVDLLERSRLVQPDQLAPEVNAAVAPLGIHVTIYMADHEQRALHPVPGPGKSRGEPLPVDTTLAGRVFQAGQSRSTDSQGRGRSPLWIPLLDGLERLGVMRVDAADEVVNSESFRSQIDLLGSLLGHLVTIQYRYGDALARARRTRRMSASSELLWRLLPPLSYATERFAVSAVFKPCYDAGGDGFDYAVDGDTAFVAICDTIGHDLRAGLGTAVALSALRAVRVDGGGLHAMAEAVDGGGLHAMAEAVDAAFADRFTDRRFTTAVLMELDLAGGMLSYLNAGHPAPVLLRGNKVAGRLDGRWHAPLGRNDPQVEIGKAQLQPGDWVLCFTDGVTEARDHDNQLFGEDRLIQLAQRHAAAGLSTPETLRRLIHAVDEHLDGPPSDDATLLLIEWSRKAAKRILP